MVGPPSSREKLGARGRGGSVERDEATGSFATQGNADTATESVLCGSGGRALTGAHCLCRAATRPRVVRGAALSEQTGALKSPGCYRVGSAGSFRELCGLRAVGNWHAGIEICFYAESSYSCPTFSKRHSEARGISGGVPRVHRASRPSAPTTYLHRSCWSHLSP